MPLKRVKKTNMVLWYTERYYEVKTFYCFYLVHTHKKSFWQHESKSTDTMNKMWLFCKQKMSQINNEDLWSFYAILFPPEWRRWVVRMLRHVTLMIGMLRSSKATNVPPTHIVIVSH